MSGCGTNRVEKNDETDADKWSANLNGMGRKSRLNLRSILMLMILSSRDPAISPLAFRHGCHGVQIIRHGDYGQKQETQNKDRQTSLTSIDTVGFIGAS